MVFKKRKTAMTVLTVALAALLIIPPTVMSASAANVADVVNTVGVDAIGQIQSVANTVIFPIVDILLGIILVVKGALAYVDYRKNHVLDWAPLLGIALCLVFALTAPLYIWDLVGVGA